ncbi:MAG: ABC transporter permease/substrate-binding protein [Pirellulaceae bacterium]|nr:ABC transporter permease/substrate-binding protein [Pirellulaceae bacterium]
MNNDLWRRIAQQFETLPDRLGGHIFLSLTALAIGMLISIPLGVWVARRPRAEQVALLLASIVQTIPSLALLALMVFAWGTIGWIPALIALVLYSVLPMLRNTITGLQNIDPAVIEAAQGVGMNQRQSLMLVCLPLALPTIVAGIRTASVWVVGAATIAQPVGATSLGNYIFVGLQTFNPVSLLFGCVFAGMLALCLDALLHRLEIAAQQRSRRLAGFVVGGLLLLIISPTLIGQLELAAGKPLPRAVRKIPESTQQQKFVVGGKAFTEQYILANVVREQLEAAGLEVELRDGMGSATTFRALETDQIDCYVEYTGTVWTNYMRRKEMVSPVEMLIDVASYLKQEKNIICLGPLGFSNDYAFAMKEARADHLGVRTLNDLAKVSQTMKGGTDIEFFDRPEWTSVGQAYGLEFAENVTMDPTLMYGAIDTGQLDVVIAFNTDGRIKAYDLRVIEDPAYSLPPYDAVLLVSEKMARNRAAMQALRPLIQSISPAEMRTANGMVDIDGDSVKQAAEYLEKSIRKKRD